MIAGTKRIFGVRFFCMSEAQTLFAALRQSADAEAVSASGHFEVGLHDAVHKQRVAKYPGLLNLVREFVLERAVRVENGLL